MSIYLVLIKALSGLPFQKFRSHWSPRSHLGRNHTQARVRRVVATTCDIEFFMGAVMNNFRRILSLAQHTLAMAAHWPEYPP